MDTQFVGTILLICMIIWLFFRREKNVDESEESYQISLADFFTGLPTITQHYLGMI